MSEEGGTIDIWETGSVKLAVVRRSFPLPDFGTRGYNKSCIIGHEWRTNEFAFPSLTKEIANVSSRLRNSRLGNSRPTDTYLLIWGRLRFHDTFKEFRRRTKETARGPSGGSRLHNNKSVFGLKVPSLRWEREQSTKSYHQHTIETVPPGPVVSGPTLPDLSPGELDSRRSRTESPNVLLGEVVLCFVSSVVPGKDV